MAAPRYSIIPGRFCDDARATLVHHRVLISLGRRTNAAGWCRISQTKLAGHLGFVRTTINEAIADLVGWGYVEKLSQAETKRNICFYRVVMDHGAPDDADEIDDGIETGPADGHSSAEGDVSATDDTPHSTLGNPSKGGGVSATGDRYVSATDDTSVGSHPTPRVGSHPTPITTPLERPPSHNDRDGMRRSPNGGAGVSPSASVAKSPSASVAPSALAPPEPQPRELALIDALVAEGRHLPIVEGLIAPILRQRRIDTDPRRAPPDAQAAFAEVARRWRDEPRPVLDAAVEAVLEARCVLVLPGHLDEAVRKARTAHVARKALDARSAREAAATSTDLVFLRRGTPAFDAFAAERPLDPLGRPWAGGAKVTATDAARYAAAAGGAS